MTTSSVYRSGASASSTGAAAKERHELAPFHVVLPRASDHFSRKAWEGAAAKRFIYNLTNYAWTTATHGLPSSGNPFGLPGETGRFLPEPARQSFDCGQRRQGSASHQGGAPLCHLLRRAVEVIE
jgi:hypothetical protein